MNMLKFTRTTPMSGDGTAWYKVETDTKCTVLEFVNEILKSDAEWGSFELKCGAFNFEYSKLLDEIPESELAKIIKSIKANGGWSNMEYIIET